MTDHSAQDRRVDAVKDRLHDELVDDAGASADATQVDAVVDAAADDLRDAPVQEFVPLLIEHEARDELREQGLRAELDDATADADVAPARDAGEVPDQGGPRLSAQQGFADEPPPD